MSKCSSSHMGWINPVLSVFISWLFLLNWFLFLSVSTGSDSATVPAFGNESDYLALLDFKNKITNDPLGIMSSWNTSLNFCNWTGVICNLTNQRVMGLILNHKSLVGSLPPSIGNLTFLTELNLRNNSFQGEIPEEVGRLLSLNHLNLSYNGFVGRIPTNLSRCTQLTIFTADYNELAGEIPDQLKSLSKLFILSLGANNLTGSIPGWLGNFSSLYGLSLALNSLQGSIPNDLGRLSSLGFFQLYGNQLSGRIPSSIYNISSIYYFSVTQNQLHGQLPTDIGIYLPNLQVFAGGVNDFTGPIPVSLPNASGLVVIDFAENRLTGTVPINLGGLQSLIRLNFDENRLGNMSPGDLDFVAYLANCTSLKVLGMAQNRFVGDIPGSIANLSSQLSILTLGSNLLRGSIPTEIQNLVQLSLLGLEGNLLTGRIPEGIGKLQQLEGLHLNYNGLSGSIPPSVGNLTVLTRLFMEENRLEGSIPSSLGYCKSLLVLNLSSNNLVGTIPKQVLELSSLSISLTLSNNSLTGSLPLEVGSLNNLVELDVSQNNLSGQIPSTLSSCASLERLYIEDNSFEGIIPQSLKTLTGLQEVDLSHNMLSGQVPEFLGKLSLKSLNLSFNNFEGEVPSDGIFLNASAVSLLGNDKLCGGPAELRLPVCSMEKSHSSNKPVRVEILVPVAVIFVISLLCSITACYMIKKYKKRPPPPPISEEWDSSVSYLDLIKSTNGFSMDNLLGSGSFGAVYKGVLHGEVVAVKVLNLQQQGASKGFIHECEALRSIRHRNLLKIVTACSSVDYQGRDFKALVLAFMSNGNLDQWLHSRTEEECRTKGLNFIQRLNIAIDVASAIDYLHHHCHSPVVHCDLKPSNILLDDNMVAHVGDFGLAMFLFEESNKTSKSQILSTGLKGSIGYIPPEYGMGGQVSLLGDVYSFGILLLEMFTGKRPTDHMFQDGLSISKYAASALPEHVMEIADPYMLLKEGEADQGECEDEKREESATMVENQLSYYGVPMEEYLVSVMKIGPACSRPLPRERMKINHALNQLIDIRDAYNWSKTYNSNTLNVRERERERD